MLRRYGPRLGAAAALSTLYVASEYRAYLELREDAAVEARLPAADDARATRVVRIPRLLNEAEIASVHDLHARAASRLGSAGRNAQNQGPPRASPTWPQPQPAP